MKKINHSPLEAQCGIVLRVSDWDPGDLASNLHSAVDDLGAVTYS